MFWIFRWKFSNISWKFQISSLKFSKFLKNFKHELKVFSYILKVLKFWLKIFKSEFKVFNERRVIKLDNVCATYVTVTYADRREDESISYNIHETSWVINIRFIK